MHMAGGTVNCKAGGYTGTFCPYSHSALPFGSQYTAEQQEEVVPHDLISKLHNSGYIKEMEFESVRDQLWQITVHVYNVNI